MAGLDENRFGQGVVSRVAEHQTHPVGGVGGVGGGMDGSQIGGRLQAALFEVQRGFIDGEGRDPEQHRGTGRKKRYHVSPDIAEEAGNRTHRSHPAIADG